MTDATKARDSIKDPPENVASGAAGPQTARRRLMLGAAAALPSVFTLTSGAQTAVASNARCWENDFRNSRAMPAVTMDHDEWLRKEVYYGRINGVVAFCAMKDQADCIDPANPAKPALGSIWMVDGDRITVSDPDSVKQISAGPQAYALVYVDRDGTIATLDPRNSGSGPVVDVQPVKESCWTSILGGRPSLLG